MHFTRSIFILLAGAAIAAGVIYASRIDPLWGLASTGAAAAVAGAFALAIQGGAIVLARSAVIAASALLVIASAGFGVSYAWQSAAPHGAMLASIAVAMALAFELAKPFAVERTFHCFRSLATIPHGLALALVSSCIVAYSLTAELTLQSMMRQDMAAERAAEASGREALEERRKRLEEKLKWTPAHRPAATIMMAISRHEGVPPDVWERTVSCTNATRPDSIEACQRIIELRAELVSAQQADELERQLEEVRKELARTGGAVGAADPGAAAIATYARAAGWMPDAAAISMWLPLIGVMALEFGATFAGVLVSVMPRPRPDPEVPPRAPTMVAPSCAPRASGGSGVGSGSGASGGAGGGSGGGSGSGASGGAGGGSGGGAGSGASGGAGGGSGGGAGSGASVTPIGAGRRLKRTPGGGAATGASLVEAWAAERVIRSRGGRMVAAEARRDFAQWCALNGHKEPPAQVFGNGMSAVLAMLGGKRASSSGATVYKGMVLTDSPMAAGGQQAAVLRVINGGTP
jgi:hypothetical protein